MRRLSILCLFPCLLAADDHWVKFTSGPFEVLTGAGARAGRETLVRFEEFRHAQGQIVGEQDLQAPLPVRILVFRNAQGWTSPAPLAEGRDRYAIVLAEKGAVSPGERHSHHGRRGAISRPPSARAAPSRALLHRSGKPPRRSQLRGSGQGMERR